MNVAIYPRRSKANDNSQSMEQQIAECEKYVSEHYSGSTIFIYDGDYALTAGKEIERRKDFQRMMDDVRAKKIQLVVIMRYDRIARNMYDFCNLYHDMEKYGCNLVSVSQQIDTSTPYGKNFMYQMAAMAELEWAIISERYKDTARYKREHGYAYTGKVPYGYKVEKQADGYKRVVKDPEKNALIVFDYFKLTRNKVKTVEYIASNYYPRFTYEMLRAMFESDLYIGKVKDNDHFCEPYLTEDEMTEIREMAIVKQTPSKRIYILSVLIECPICGRRMDACQGGTPKRNRYRCGYYHHKVTHKGISVTEDIIEAQLLERLEPILEEKIIKRRVKPKKQNKSCMGLTEALNKQLERLNYLFEKGRMEVDEYEQKYSDIELQLSQIIPEPTEDYEQIKKSLPENWKEIYQELDAQHKMNFMHGIIDKIILDSNRNVADIKFKV